MLRTVACALVLAFAGSFDAQAIDYGGAPPARVRGYAPSNSGDFRLEVDLPYHWSSYSAYNPHTNQGAQLAGGALGVGFKAEGWVTSWLGILAEASRDPLKSASDGTSVLSTQARANLALRYAGPGGGMGSESILFAGASYSLWPLVQNQPQTGTVDVTNFSVTGLQAGLRWRWALAREWVLEYLIEYGFPLGQLSNGRFFEGLLAVDYLVAEGISLGLGGAYSMDRVSLVPNSAQYPNDSFTVDNNMATAFARIRFWF